MSREALIAAIVGSNAVALLILVLCWCKPTAGRVLFAAMFAWAGPWNLYTVWTQPAVYQDYAQWAVLAFYRDFILGSFAQHTQFFVSIIAAGQIAVAMLVASSGSAVRLGLLGGIVFLAAITPLGIGSGFPFTLLTIGAAWLLWRQEHPVSLPVLAWRRIAPRT